MRNAFADEMTKLADEDSRTVLLSGDIGNRLFDTYKAAHPDRFYNCGVAEANMTSVAAGMALAGMRPITYTIAAFNTLRCLEQIRLDVCYQNLPVVIVGVGAGLSYASLNSSHHALEDIACLRTLPNMAVVCPGDAYEVRAALRCAIDHDGPIYLRMGKKNEPLIHDDVPEFVIGKGIIVRPGTDVCLLSTGTMLPSAMETAQVLSGNGVSAQVVSFHTVKPLDETLLAEAFSGFRLVASIEEHGISGGLGGAIAEWLVENPCQSAGFQRFGCGDTFMYEAGEQDHAREYFGLTPDDMSGRILEICDGA